MPKNIVLCFDGTNNKYCAKTDTNVVKLYQMLDKSITDQIAYYQPGIGTMPPPGMFGKFKQKIADIIDLATAWLLNQHVGDGYEFLMRYYEPGDKIFLFGFSRGAYTARAVAAMVHKVGLLTQGNEDLVPFAWDIFKNSHDPVVSEGFKNTFSRAVDIHFVGVWDTVSSVGWVWNPKHLPFTAENPGIKIARHAMAVDEHRAMFVQNLFVPLKGGSQDLLQVWFAGVHCDVGGFYPEPAEAGLAKCALRWMLDEAKKQGLLTVSAKEAEIIPVTSNASYSAPDYRCKPHESLTGWWNIVEWLPKLYFDPAHGFKRRLMIHWYRRRYIAPNPAPNVHSSLDQRIKDATLNYKPSNLPTPYNVIT